MNRVGKPLWAWAARLSCGFFSFFSHQKFKKLFLLDTRSLAIFRILLGSIIFYDIVFVRFPYLREHYSDYGVLPRVAEHFHTAKWSFHYLNGEPWFQGMIFGIMLVLAVCMIIGYHTRFVTFLLWLGTLSVQHRNPHLLSGADGVLRVLMLWACFLPLNARLSVDNLKNKVCALPESIASISSAGLILQICTIYLTAAGNKISAVWIKDLTAVNLAFQFDMLATPLAEYLLNFPELLKILTFLTIMLEWSAGPVTLISAYFWKARMAIIALMLFFHLIAIQSTLTVGTFGAVCAAGWLALLPPEFWQTRPLRSTIQKLQSLQWPNMFKHFPSSERPFKNPKFIEQLTFILIIVMTFTAVNKVFGDPISWLNSRKIKWIQTIGFKQSWRMFSPRPVTSGGWFIMAANIQNEEHPIDLLQDGAKLIWERPKKIYKHYANVRWQKTYYALIASKKSHLFAPYLGQYLLKSWNDNNPEKRISSCNLNHMIELSTIGEPPPIYKAMHWNYPVNNSLQIRKAMLKFYNENRNYE